MMLRKVLAILLIIGGVTAILSTFANWTADDNIETHQIIRGEEIPKTATNNELLPQVSRCGLDVRSFTELRLNYFPQKTLGLWGKKALIIRNVIGKSNEDKISLVYHKGIIIDMVMAMNVQIINISIVATPEMNILVILFRIPWGKVGTITIRYHAKIRYAELFTSYVRISEDWSIFRTAYEGNEVVLSSLWLLREVEIFDRYESRVVVGIPRDWKAVVIDEKGEGFWGRVNSMDGGTVPAYSSKSSRNPVIIAGNFSSVDAVTSGVSIKVHQVKEQRKDVLASASKILRSYSKLLGNYPYSTLQILYLESLNTNAGFEFPRGIVLIHPHRNETLLLAHEIAHVWFGDYASFGRMDETLASYLALTYEGFPWAINSTEHSPIVDSAYTLEQVYRESLNNPHVEGIIYYKGASVFRSLQFVLGNETFFRCIRELLRVCHNRRECSLTDVQDVFENVSGQKLNWFFNEWFYTTKVPNYYVKNLSLKSLGKKYVLSFEIVDENSFKMPLEIEVVTAKGNVIRRIWVQGRSRVSFELDEKPEAIVLDPNEWILNRNRDYTEKGIKIRVE